MLNDRSNADPTSPHKPGFLTRCLGRLSVGHKLLLIFLLDMSAVFYISGILIDEKFLAIDFARSELGGNAYIAELRYALLSSAAVALEAKTFAPQVVQTVQDAEFRHGAELGSEAANQSFVRTLQRLAAKPAEAERVRVALARGRDLVTRVGNQSKLILDPDLDSYYTMSIIVLRVPELLASLAELSMHATTLPQQGLALDNETRARFLLLEGRLEHDIGMLEADYREALAAGGPAMQQGLDPSRRKLLTALGHYRRVVRSTLADAAQDGVDHAALLQAHRQALESVGQAWQSAGAQLDTLLHARIDASFQRMWQHLGTALGLLMLILTAVFFVARQIAVPLRHLAGVADLVGRTGDHHQRAHWHSGDEIGRLVLRFNDMLEQLDRERTIQQELAASARAAQAQQQLVEAMPIPMMVTAVPDHQVLHANDPAHSWLDGCTDDPWRAGLDPSVRLRFFQQLADRDVVDGFEVCWRAGAEPSWAVLSARQLQFQGRRAVLTAFTPINHLKVMERRLELWGKVFEATTEGIVIFDAERRVLSANQAWCRNNGHELHELIGTPLGAIDGRPGSGGFLDGLVPVLAQGSSWQGEVTLQRRDGSTYPAWLMLSLMRDGQQGTVSHYIATTIDISDRKRNEERIRFLAQHDVLTELPNRSLCVERLRLALQQAGRSGSKVAVLFIDLDRFKYINDSLGHHIGDGLLRSVARRLVDSVRAGDTVSRLGGDEFVVVLNGVADVEEVVTIIDQRLVPQVRQPHDCNGSELQVSSSIGVALYPDDAQDLDTLLRHADAAMYQAKAQGRDTVHFFTPELNERAQRRMKLESNLRHAIERSELRLEYQPRVDARSKQLVGVEALLRWHSHELGAVAPTQFIPIAEDTRLIVSIGAWVIDEACRQLARWRVEGLAVPQVSVNVSALQLRDDDLIDTVHAALQRHAVPPAMIELELTESMLMDRADETLQRLHAIKSLGVELAIDDFGTGYSSLNYLNRFPIDRLKIDRSFVRDMLEDPSDLAITRTIIGLGHTLGLKVVAEGVEVEREAETLASSGCDELQGYLYSRPLPAAALAEWLRQRTGQPA